MCIRDRYQVNDKAYNKLNFSIHNYFFAKALDQVRPGGVVAFVTSRYTMDAKDSTVRDVYKRQGWDYTLYDAASMKELDGGQLDMPEISRMKAVLQICDDNDLGRDSVK